jgi:hypothetical protein
LLDKIPLGPFMNKGLSIKTGQTCVKRYTEKFLGEIDQSFGYPQSPARRRPGNVQNIPRQRRRIKVVLKPQDVVIMRKQIPLSAAADQKQERAYEKHVRHRERRSPGCRGAKAKYIQSHPFA